MTKLDVRAFGFALGILWGGAMFLLGLMVMFFNWGTGWVTLMSSLYIGFKPTLSGSVIGGIWGFLDAGIGGVVLAWLYNSFMKKSQ